MHSGYGVLENVTTALLWRSCVFIFATHAKPTDIVALLILVAVEYGMQSVMDAVMLVVGPVWTKYPRYYSSISLNVFTITSFTIL